MRKTTGQKPSKRELERQLDNALEQTFPASDPLSIGEPTALKPERPAGRRAPLIDRELVNELARNVRRQHAHRDTKNEKNR